MVKISKYNLVLVFILTSVGKAIKKFKKVVDITMPRKYTIRSR